MPKLDYRFPKTPTPSKPPVRPSGAVVVGLAVAALAFAGAVVYAGPASFLVFYRLLIGGLVVLLWTAAGAGVGALVLRAVLGGQAGDRVGDRSRAGGRLLYFVTATALGLGLIGLAGLGLGLAGGLRGATAWALLVSGALCGVVFLLILWRDAEKGKSTPAPPTRAAPEGERGRLRWHWLWLAAGPFLAVALVGTTVPPGMLWSPEEPHGYDVAEYHLQVPREWYEAGRIVPLRHNVFSYFPMGVEVHYLLAMHLSGGPWDGMYLAQLMHLAMAVLAVLAVWGVARQFTSDWRCALVAAVAAATVPWLAQIGAIAYTEGGFLLFGTLAVGWALRGMTAPSAGGHRLRDFLVGGAMAGLACGTKLTAVPELLLGVPGVCAAALLVAARGNALVRPRAVLAGCVAYGVVGAVLFAPWLARDVAWTGNPVFPEAAKVLGKAHWNDVQVERWHKANHEPGADHRGPAGRLRAGWEQILGSWQYGFLLVPLSLVALVRCAAAGWRRPAVLVPGTMLVLLAIFWIGFTHLQGRFFLLAVPLGAMLIAQVDWRRQLPWVAGAVLVAASVGWWNLHGRITAAVLGTAAKPGGLADAMGRTPLDWLTPTGLEGFPQTPGELRDHPEARLALVGEARAFWYQVPMARLRYRTVFDVDTTGFAARPDGKALVNVWAGRPPGAEAPAGEWEVISGPELQRFARTYFEMPPPPPGWVKGEEPMVVQPGGAGR